MRGKLEDSPEAIRRLRELGVPVQERAFGFSLEHSDWPDAWRRFADCGCEHDFSISLSVSADESPPVVWFFRFDMLEMVDFISSAYRLAADGATSTALLAAFRADDSRYDHNALERRLEQWQRDFDDFWRNRPGP
ncbi:MAG: hypothetical protein V4726_21390 [Verrucomicrobiota bacterium]